jgi:hypothetical protein
VSGITSRERQDGMYNRSLKVSTRCAGSPARLESSGKRREGDTMGRNMAPKTAVCDGQYVAQDVCNIRPVALGAAAGSGGSMGGRSGMHGATVGTTVPKNGGR